MNKGQFNNIFLSAVILMTVASVSVFSQKSATGTSQVRGITITTEPGAVVWLDDLRYGRTSKSGNFTIDAMPPGAHKIRVRADGFKETTYPISAAVRGEVKIALVKTNDPAELAFQEAERLSAVDRDAAIAAYRKAIKLKPNYTTAYISLARVLADAQDPDGAKKALQDLRKVSPRNAEASAVEGRILKDLGDEEKAIAAFKRSIAEGRGVQPEAYTGLGLLYKERGEGSGGDPEIESTNFAEASKNLKIALKQLGSAPDALVLYQLLGLVYERQGKYQEAIDLYRECLRYFPNSNESVAIRSFIDQLEKKLAQKD